MALSRNIPELDKSGLRNFGITTGVIIAGLFGVFFPWLLDRSSPLWPWAVFGVLVAWALIAPRSLGPVYRGWMRFGVALSRITTPIIMGLVFFVVILPFGLVRRLFGQDSMQRKMDEGVKSYRIESTENETDTLENPY